MDQDLNQQLLSSVKGNYARVLHRTHLGYSGYRTLDLITELYTMYAVITKSGWILNNTRFYKANAPTDPINVVWRKIDNTVEYAKARATL